MKKTAETDILRCAVAVAVVFLIFILQYSGLIPLGLWGMTAMLVLPSVVYCSMYLKEFTAAMVGLFMGICLDAVSKGAVCFHALFMMFAGCFSALIFKHLFHKNIMSAILVSAILSFLFFVTKWLVFTAFAVEGAWSLFWSHSLPSVFYTVAISLPLYPLFKLVFKGRKGASL